MGWASASSLVESLVKDFKILVPNYDQRVRIYLSIIDNFQNHDWDTQDEVLGYDEAYDESYKIRYGED